MTNKEGVDILNNIVNKMGVEGFYFGLGILFEIITIYIPRELKGDNDKNKCFWNSFEKPFTYTSSFSVTNLLYSIGESRKRNRNILDDDNPTNLLGINDNGVKFLEILSGCSSFKEFIMKLQLMGY